MRTGATAEPLRDELPGQSGGRDKNSGKDGTSRVGYPQTMALAAIGQGTLRLMRGHVDSLNKRYLSAFLNMEQYHSFPYSEICIYNLTSLILL
jgi:hypothetical protein